MHRGMLFAGVAAIAGALAFNPTAEAQSVDLSSPEMIVPFSEGGGTGTLARFFQPYIQKYLPDNAALKITYMPGGSCSKGGNYFEERAPNDGSMIFFHSGSCSFPWLLGDPRHKFNLDEWRPFLATPVGGVVYINPDFGVLEPAQIPELRDEKFIFGSQGPTSLDLIPVLGFEKLGLNVEPVFGLGGRGDGRLMFERGEVNIDYQVTAAYLKSVVPMVEEGRAAPLMTWGMVNSVGDIIRDPTFPHMPTYREVYKILNGEHPSGPWWNAWKAFFVAGYPAQKALWLPADAPDEALAQWTEVAQKLAEDPEFVEASKDFGNYRLYVGEDAVNLTKIGTNVDPEAKEWILTWLKDRFDITIN